MFFKYVFQKGRQAVALQRTILIVLSISRSSHQKVVISLNFSGFEFQPFVFPVQLFIASLVHQVMEKLLSTQHILPMTALTHCVIKTQSKLFQCGIMLAESFTVQGIFIAQITLGTLLDNLSSFSTF